MLLPTGYKLRLRSTEAAQNTAATLDVKNACTGREITLLEPAELRRPKSHKPSPQVQAVVLAWENFRSVLASQSGQLSVPQNMLPLAQAIDRLKAAA